MIDIQHLQFQYNEHSPMIFEDLNLTIHKAETVGIVGCNGVGKSTLLKLLTGLEMAKGITMFGLEMNEKNKNEIRKQLGYVFQDSQSQLFMNTVYEDVAFGPLNYGLENVDARVDRALDLVHMKHKRDARVYQLSGGEMKLASIATILPMEPKLLLLDEPTVGLDPRNRRQIIRVLNELKYTKVVTSHDLDFIYDTCQRTIVLGKDGIVADGKSHEILTNQKLLEDNGLELPLSFSRR